MTAFRALSSVVLAILLAAPLTAGELTVNPRYPKKGKSVSFKYTPGKEFTANSPLHLILYGFAEGATLPTARRIDLEFDRFAKVYRGDVQLDSNDVFALVKVSDGTRIDNNKRNMWNFLVSEDFKKPVEGAYTRQAVSLLGNLPEPCKRPINFKAALKALELELGLYPHNLQAAIGKVSLDFELKNISPEEYKRRMTAILDAPVAEPKAHYGRALVRAWNGIGKPEKAKEAQQYYLERFPDSEFAQEIAFKELSTVRQPETFVEKARSFLANFPSSENVNRIQTGVVNIFIGRQDYQAAEDYLNSLKKPSAFAYNLLAIALSSDTLTDVADARRIAEEAVALARNPDSTLKPPYLTYPEWKKETDYALGLTLDTYGVALYDMGEVDEAIRVFREALMRLSERAEDIHYEHLMDIYIERGSYKDAYALASNAIYYSNSNDYLLEQHQLLFDEVMRGQTDYEAELNRLLDEARARRLEKLSEERLDSRVKPGALSRLDGGKVDLKSFRGKVVILDFWASWCGPCKRSFPSLDDLYKQYQDRDDVEIVVVNCWERSDDRVEIVRKFKEDTGYSFPMYLDLDDSVVARFGVTGIPTKFYIDKHGLVQFKEVGFAGDEEFKNHASDIIELLSSDDFYRQ